MYLALRRKARADGRSTDELLQLAALEAFVDRLSTSARARDLVLKGGVLLAAYDLRRPTRDVDLSAQRVANDLESVRAMVAEILTEPRDDGWVYGRLSAETIREGDPCSGVRVTLRCTLARAHRLPHRREHRRRRVAARLPMRFETVVSVNQTFAEPLMTNAAADSVWDPAARRWST